MESNMTQRLDALFELHSNTIRYAGPKNSVIKHIQGLISNTKPNPRKFFVLEGIWAFNMALKANLTIVNFVLSPECIHSIEAFNLVEEFMRRAEDTSIVSKKVFEKISERDEPDGLIAVCLFPETNLKDIKTKDSIILVLDGLEIPGNTGTIIRSADAANADAIFICNRRARLTHPKLIKGSMGAIFFKPIVEFATISECKEWLAKNKFDIYLADTRAEKGYYEYDYTGNAALVMGSERYGISKEWYESDINMLSIPMLGECDSLNVAIATTVILYEIRLKKDKKK